MIYYKLTWNHIFHLVPHGSYKYIDLVLKVRQRANIRDRYNQVPHLTKVTNGKVTNSQLDITNESQEVSPFPAGDQKAPIHRCAGKQNKHKTEITRMIHKRSTALEWLVKIRTHLEYKVCLWSLYIPVCLV